MADIYAVKFNNSGGVNIPLVTLETTYTLKIRFQTGAALATDALIATAGETGGAPTNFIAVYANGDIRVRKAGVIVYQSALSLFAANKRYDLTMTVTSSTASLTVLNITDSTTTINAASFAMTGQFTFDRIGTGGASTALAFSGLIGEVETTGRRYISTVNTGSTWADTVGGQNGTLTSLPTDGTQWAFYEASGDPAPTGVVTLGTPTDITSNSATIPYFYSENDETGFEYRVNGGAALTVTTSPLVVTGLTASTFYSVEMRAVNGSTPGDWSDPVTFTTAAGGDTTPPTFTVAPAVSSITQTGGTATATINETGSIFYVVVPQADATPSVAQVIAGQTASGTAPIDSGSAVGTATLSDAFTGATAGAAYKACFVARDDEPTPNVQASVTVVNFNAAAAPVGTITLTGLANNTATLWSGLSGISCTVMNEAATSIVVTKTGLTANAGGDATFNDAAITASTWYTVVIVSGTNRGIIRIQAT